MARQLEGLLRAPHHSQGIPRAAVELALGEPTQIGSPATDKADEVWTYRKDGEMVGIFFKGGKVIGWKKKKAGR